MRRNIVTPSDIATKRNKRAHLFIGKRMIAAIIKLNTNRSAVYIGFTGPETAPGMPSTLAFAHQLENPAIQCDQIMRRHLMDRIA